jgi:hypothetical protein
MMIYATPQRLAVLLGAMVLAWLLFFTGVLPADVAVSVSFIVILYALAPMSGRLGQDGHRRD